MLIRLIVTTTISILMIFFYYGFLIEITRSIKIGLVFIGLILIIWTVYPRKEVIENGDISNKRVEESVRRILLVTGFIIGLVLLLSISKIEPIEINIRMLDLQLLIYTIYIISVMWAVYPRYEKLEKEVREECEK